MRLGRSGRWAVSIALVVLASLLVVVSVVARYVRSELLDTDRYVETVSPLASEPAVQDAVATQVTSEIVTRLDVEAVAEDALSRLTELGAPEVITGLAVPLADQVESFVRDHVEQFLRSDEFATLWDDANRRAHTAVVGVLTGETRGAVSVEGGAVTVDLGEVVSRVKDRLVDRGLDLASNIPDVESSFTLVESEQLENAQRWVRILDSAATLLPFVVIALAAVAILVAPNRRRALVAVALGAALSMVLLAAAMGLVRAWYLSNATGEVLPTDAALDIARTLLAPLRLAMRAVLVLGLVVALAAFLVGPSAPARWLRSLGSRASGRHACAARGRSRAVARRSLDRWPQGRAPHRDRGRGRARPRLLDLPERRHSAVDRAGGGGRDGGDRVGGVDPPGRGAAVVARSRLSGAPAAPHLSTRHGLDPGVKLRSCRPDAPRGSHRPMPSTDDAAPPATPAIDKEELRRRYAAERDKRLRPDGNDQYLRLQGQLPTTSTTRTSRGSSASRWTTTSRSPSSAGASPGS